MRYKSFKIDDDEAINAFLAEHSDGLAPDSVHEYDGYISFIYTDYSREELIHENAEAIVNKFVGEKLAELVTHDILERFHTGKTGKEHAQQAVIAATNKHNTANIIEAASALLPMLVDRSWFAAMKEKSLVLKEAEGAEAKERVFGTPDGQ